MAAKSIQILEPSGKEEVDQQICSLCLTQFAKYTCPRCNVRYCSLSCYKCEKHVQCSETFYRESFMTELKQRKGSAEEKRHMLDMLKRLDEDRSRSGDVDSSEDIDTLEDRLSGLDLDEDVDVVWERLTDAERRDFQQLVQSGGAGHLLPDYTPWWEVVKLVIPVGQATSTPAVLPNLPPLQTLVKSGAVSSQLRYSVLNVLYAYASAVRLFNGEHKELCLQASQTVLDISTCLSSSNCSFAMVSEALHYARMSAQKNSVDFSTAVLKDVSCILCHPKSHDCHVMNALSDLHELLSLARQKVKGGRSEIQDGGNVSKKLWFAKKKVYFFAVWCSEREGELGPLAKLVDIEYESLCEEFKAQKNAESKINIPQSAQTLVALDGKRQNLIEELS